MDQSKSIEKEMAKALAEFKFRCLGKQHFYGTK
jgi:hypothetical protein